MKGYEITSEVSEEAKRGVKGKTIYETREEARAALARTLLFSLVFLAGVSLLIGAYLMVNLPENRFSSKDMLNLVLGVGSIFSGLLGAAITFYFSSKAGSD